MDRLALLLDRKMRLIPNWTQLARELRVDDAVISRLEQYSNHSPTIQLFDYLEVKQPNLSIQQLRKGLTQINRNDLNVLLTNGNYVPFLTKMQLSFTSNFIIYQIFLLACDGSEELLDPICPC